MTPSVHRIGAIALADFRLRFRRLSTVVVFLLLSAVPYLWIPDPSTGRALLQSAGSRVLYDSPAIGMATATLASIFIGLFGFYVISNAIRRDTVTRCGFVIASTPAGSGEYLFGKFAGNLLFLTTFVAGFMTTSMAMLLVRGEAPLRPLIFIKQYLLLVPPAIVLVSVIAIVFESIPLLSGKFGDVAYFFVWLGSLGVVASRFEDTGAQWLLLFDFTGFGYLMENVRATLHTDNLSIGSSTFDASKPVITFPGVTAANGWWWKRLGSALMPIPLLLVARLFFHRFDPARVRKSADRARRTWTGRFNALLKPLTRPIYALLALGSNGTSILAAARTDAALTLTNFPLILAAAVGVAIAAFATPLSEISSGVLPLAFAALGVAISDVATRERRSGTMPLVFAAPGLRERFVVWKLISTLLFSVLFMLVPLAKVAIGAPEKLPAALAGVLFVIAAATALGVFSGTPKTFIVIFLSFWYVALNGKGENPGSDFAGFYSPPAAVTVGYLVAAVVLVVAADLWHRRMLGR
jgi:ABC-type transport system involved in multi-copper enzyme maturation permease subunit